MVFKGKNYDSAVFVACFSALRVWFWQNLRRAMHVWIAQAVLFLPKKELGFVKSLRFGVVGATLVIQTLARVAVVLV
jgi:hypothetical protein